MGYVFTNRLEQHSHFYAAEEPRPMSDDAEIFLVMCAVMSTCGIWRIAFDVFRMRVNAEKLGLKGMRDGDTL